MRKVVTISLKDEEVIKIDKIAKEQDRTRSAMIAVIIKEYIKKDKTS